MCDIVVCSVEEACKLMKHMNKDDMVVLTIINKKNYTHNMPQKIKKKRGEELIKQADDILYQDNDFFGILSLYGILAEKGIIHNILFPQLG